MNKILAEIIKTNNQPAIEYFGNVFDDLVHELYETNPMWYKTIEYNLHKYAYGKSLTEMQSKQWVSGMSNKDGTIGEHWTYEQTTEILKSNELKYNPYDFYAVMNMIYSDYYNPKFDTETYLMMSKDWLDDKDVDGCKTLKYYMFIAGV